MRTRDEDQEGVKDYKKKDLTPQPRQADTFNVPAENTPAHNKPQPDEEYLHQYSNEGKKKNEIQEIEVPSEHKNIIDAQSPGKSTTLKGYQKRKPEEEQKVFQTKRFNRPFDVDQSGVIQQTAVSGTVTSRYTLLDNSLQYVKLDQLTVYDEQVNGVNRKKFESMTVKFSSLDKETQLMLRKRFEKTGRKLSAEGLKYIADSEGGLRNKVYNAKTSKEATDEEIAGRLSKEGDWTIGYGHKLTKEELAAGTFLKEISDEHALSLYNKDLEHFVAAVNERLKVFVSQNEFDALVSFAYQQGYFGQTFATVMNFVNQYKFEEAATYIQNTGNKRTRRKSEAEIFRHSIYIPQGYYDKDTGKVNDSYYKTKDPKGYKKYKNPVIF